MWTTSERLRLFVCTLWLSGCAAEVDEEPGQATHAAQSEQALCTGTITIDSPAALQAHSRCEVIQGDLHIASGGLSAITASDLPHLTRVTGALRISAHLNTGSSPQLASITLPKLQSVGGELLLGATLPPSELHLPELRSVGKFRLVQTAVRVVDAPKLATVTGDAELNGASYLCTLNLPALDRVEGNLNLSMLDKLPSSQATTLRSATRGTITESWVGCCHISDRAECGDVEPEDLTCGC